MPVFVTMCLNFYQSQFCQQLNIVELSAFYWKKNNNIFFSYWHYKIAVVVFWHLWSSGENYVFDWEPEVCFHLCDDYIMSVCYSASIQKALLPPWLFYYPSGDLREVSFTKVHLSKDQTYNIFLMMLRWKVSLPVGAMSTLSIAIAKDAYKTLRHSPR